MPEPAAVTRAATLGLAVAWAAHDLEEALTMPAWSRRLAPRLRWGRELSPDHVAVAIGLMGVLVAAAAAAGARSGGRSRLYQAALVGFGWHAAGHVLAAAAFRGYVPGLVTSPLVAAPFSIWAWRRLAAAGVATDGRRAGAAATLLVPSALIAAHGLAWALTSARWRGSGPPRR
jgi:Protein of unknown function with HXXEE motif